MDNDANCVGKRLGAAKTAIIMRNRRAEWRALYIAQPKTCEQCQKAIGLRDGDKPNDIQIKRFCSQRCAALFNQTHTPHRVPKISRICRVCDCDFIGERKNNPDRAYCVSCWTDERNRKGMRSKSNLSHAEIRGHARAILRRAKPELICNWCGYDKHVECCHLTPVGSFSPSTMLQDINHISNLCWLCRNCHWELDHGMMKPQIAVAA